MSTLSTMSMLKCIISSSAIGPIDGIISSTFQLSFDLYTYYVGEYAV